MSTPMTLEQKNHAEWVAGLRAEYARRCTGAPAVQSTGCDTFAAQPGMGFDAFAAPPLHEMFDDALDLDFDEPVYRSMGNVAWQPADDELDFEDEPVYRSLGQPEAALEVEDAHAAWMQSMPPLVHRQSAFQR